MIKQCTHVAFATEVSLAIDIWLQRAYLRLISIVQCHNLEYSVEYLLSFAMLPILFPYCQLPVSLCLLPIVS